MDKTDIMNIEMGDYFYVDVTIHKRILSPKAFLVYKPNKFYRIMGFLERKIRNVKIQTSSELGLNTISVIRNNEIPIYIKHFTLIKQSDYKEVKNIEFFEELQ